MDVSEPTIIALAGPYALNYITLASSSSELPLNLLNNWTHMHQLQAIETRQKKIRHYNY